MIALLEGKVAQKGASVLVLNVGGVGFKVSATHEVLHNARVGTTLSVHTHLAVREDSLELYGFSDEKSRAFFELLLTVSGIGPKTALAILNIAPLKNLQSAIASGDPSHLTKTTGLGTKRAERIVMELKDKLEIAEGDLSIHRDTSDVIEALKALGYSQKEARDAIQKLPTESITPEEKIKQALKIIGK